MAYSFGEGKEIFTLDEFKDNFNIDNVSLGGPVFDLVKLGWINNQHMRLKDLKGEGKEIFTLDEFKDNFNIDNVSLGGPVFDLVKLGWINNQHMRLKDLKELTEMTIPFFRANGFVGEEISDKEMVALERIVEIIREHAHTLKEIADESAVYFRCS